MLATWRRKAALVDIIIKRRGKSEMRSCLPAVNPLVAPRLTETHLTFENAAVMFDVAKARGLEGCIDTAHPHSGATPHDRQGCPARSSRSAQEY